MLTSPSNDSQMLSPEGVQTFCNWALLHFIWVPIYCFNKAYLDSLSVDSLVNRLMSIWIIAGLVICTAPALLAPLSLFYRLSFFVQRVLLAMLAGVLCIAASVGLIIAVGLLSKST